MRVNSSGLMVVLLWTSCAVAQVLSPVEMKDPAMRALQKKHLGELRSVSDALNKIQFPYPFYFSRKLDMEEDQQKQADQRSIRFELYNKQRALEITGNYFAAYSNERLDTDHRMRQTFLNVVLPILQVVVPPLQASADFDVFAVEVSHHVRRKVMGMNGEYAENLVVVIPRELAARVVQSHDELEQQAMLQDAEVYYNGEPSLLWLAGEKPLLPDGRPGDPASSALVASVHPTVSPALRAPAAPVAPLPPAKVPPELSAEPLHDSTPDALKELQTKYQSAIDALTKEQGKDAHFVAYAPPSFISFKQGTYLQLSLTTALDASSADSQYKLAALAFDRHVAHLVRPVLGYFKDASGFDGFDFSTTVKINGDNEHALAVEFILPLSALRCYQQYDCTGQQALNAGFILINGERAGVELQTAEAK